MSDIYNIGDSEPAQMRKKLETTAKKQSSKNIEIADSDNFTELGGWLVFFVLLTIIGVVYSVMQIVETLATASIVNNMRIINILTMDVSVIFAYAAMSVSWITGFVLVVLIVRKNNNFLLFYHMRFLFYIIITVITIFSGASETGFSSNYTTVLTLIFNSIVTALITTYFVASKRVQTYMGGFEYVQRNPLTRLAFMSSDKESDPESECG